MAQQPEVPAKKWYQSKIVLFALALVAVAGGNLLTGFLSGNVTPDQLDAIRAAYPQAAEIIERLKNGESILSVVGILIGLLISIFRVWFTPSLIVQSAKTPPLTR